MNSNLLFYITTGHPAVTQAVRRLLASRTEIPTPINSMHKVTMAQEGDTEQPQEKKNRKVRPVITPDAFLVRQWKAGTIGSVILKV